MTYKWRLDKRGLLTDAAALAFFVVVNPVHPVACDRNFTRVSLIVKCLPLLGCRTKTMISYLFLSCGLDILFYKLSEEFMQFPISMFNLIWGLMLIAFAFAVMHSRSMWRLSLLEKAERNLCLEHDALNVFTSHLCDAFLRISPDGQRITECDKQFIDYMGSDAHGMMVEECFSSSSVSILHALQTATHMVPVLLPVDLKGTQGTAQRATLIIVRKLETDKLLKAGEYLVALNMLEEFNRSLPPQNDDLPDLSIPSQHPAGDESQSWCGRPASTVAFQTATKEHDFASLIKLGQTEHWLIEYSRVLVSDTILGSGSFGKVVKGSFHSSPVAVKVAHSKADVTLLVELRLLRHVRHPNIVLFHGACIDASRCQIALIFELITGPTLHDLIIGKTSVPVATSGKLDIAVGIGYALEYLHDHNPRIVHGDLKPANIFVEFGSEALRSKLGDFGLSRRICKDLTVGGTMRWAAPEIFSTPASLPDAASDVFSFGRVLNFIVLEKLPFSDRLNEDITAMARSGMFPPMVWPTADPLTKICSSLANKCISNHPGDRPSMQKANQYTARWHDTLKRASAGSQTSDASSVHLLRPGRDTLV